MRSPCLIEGCGKPLKRFGLCQMHDRRRRVHGDPFHAIRSPFLDERLMALIDARGDCWQWTGTVRQRDGYGQTQVNGRAKMAHRVVYEWLVGPIPDGLGLDHLCRNRSCVNPDHLEPVTQLINNHRGAARFVNSRPRKGKG